MGLPLLEDDNDSSFYEGLRLEIPIYGSKPSMSIMKNPKLKLSDKNNTSNTSDLTKILNDEGNLFKSFD